MERIEISLNDNRKIERQIYHKVGNMENEVMSWGEEGGISSVLQKMDELKKEYGEPKTLQEVVRRIHSVAVGKQLYDYQINMEIKIV